MRLPVFQREHHRRRRRALRLQFGMALQKPREDRTAIVQNCMLDNLYRRTGGQVRLLLEPPCELSDVPLPDVAVIQNGNMLELAEAFARRGVPCVAYFHGLPFECAEQDWPRMTVQRWFTGYIANSTYTATRFRARCGIDAHVIPPVFNPARYQASGERRFATFINPVAAKGVELALAVAALCPEISFRFVKAWPLSPAQSIRLKRRITRLRRRRRSAS